jgi:hypothetical protein
MALAKVMKMTTSFHAILNTSASLTGRNSGPENSGSEHFFGQLPQKVF